MICLPAVQTSRTSLARSEIQQQYDRLNTAFRNHDASVFEAMMAKGFMTDTPDGKTMDREQSLRAFKGMMATIREASWTRTVDKVSLAGSIATATVSGKFVGRMPGADHRLHRTVLKSVVQDTWRGASHRWQIERSKMLKMSMTVDGKNVEPH